MTSQDGSNDIPAVFSVPSTRPSTSKLKPKPTITLTLCMDNSSQGIDYPRAVVAKPFSSNGSILRVMRIAFKDYLSPNQDIECGLARKTTDGCIRWVKLFDWESSVAADSKVGIFLKGSNMHDFPYLPPPTGRPVKAQSTLGCDTFPSLRLFETLLKL
ncbi:hypothetical protein CPB84DRAFT_1784517 [Gymnopilus junonius]|uniref:Uncharacterized protein n=1 Tax=Gymnopilus junonius TaxID=109634 RepID=A0A9P5NJV4_GYMJU|nr:hypothetical protein CPB84DRAFT_1784517 [Gymnopilus junonius]